MNRFFYLTTALLVAPILSQALSSEECVCSPQQTSKAFTSVAKKAMPAVLFIKVQSTSCDLEELGNPNYPNPFDSSSDDLFNRFSPSYRGQSPKPSPQLSQGSGFFVTSDGYVMTNAHVIKGADKISVVLHDGRELDATLVGADLHTDIAIIKVEGKDFPYLKMGDADAMDVGEWVIAIGSPFQLEASLTVGVISAKGRQNLKITDLEDFIQTDAAINPGNSGGPLLNLDSEVIGINTAIVSRSGGYMGIGFAVPSSMAQPIMHQLIDKGSVTRGFLGVSLQPVDKDIADAFKLSKVEGALISEVIKDSPAEKAGLKQGDIILEYNKTLIKSLPTFRKEISMMAPGSSVTMKINRKGEILFLPVTLGTSSDTLATADGIVQKLGMEVDTLTPDIAKQLGYSKGEEGIVVMKVKPGSPAALAGIRPGFLILAVNHRKIATVADFNDAMNSPEIKNRILILAKQSNVTRFYSIKLD